MKSKVLLVLSVLLGLMFINSGLNKFFHYMPMPANLPEEVTKDFAAFMEISWLFPLVAVVEIIGAILLMIPKTRAIGALTLLPIIVGVLCYHLFVDTSTLPVAVIIAAILGWIMFENRNKYLQLLG